jgi:hypothetical protein
MIISTHTFTARLFAGLETQTLSLFPPLGGG